MHQSTRNRLLHFGSHGVDLIPASLEPGSNRAREDPGAQSAGTQRRRDTARKEDIRDIIKAAATIGATILWLRLYAAIAPSSPW